jgi:hypothetical protein
MQVTEVPNTGAPARLRFEGRGYALDPDESQAWRGVEVVRAEPLTIREAYEIASDELSRTYASAPPGASRERRSSLVRAADLTDAEVGLASVGWKLVKDSCPTCERSWTDAHHVSRDLPPSYCPVGHGRMHRTVQALVPAGPEIPAVRRPLTP